MIAVALDRGVEAARFEWDGLSSAERGKRLKAAIDAHDLTQTELMKITDISLTTINRWINGKAEMPWPRWLSVCGLLGIAPSWKPAPKKQRPSQAP